MIPDTDDEDEQRDSILKMLGGEVDDFAGKQLPEEGKESDGGTSITITVKGPASVEGPSEPGSEDEENAGGEDKESMLAQEEDEPHDPIAHILGMCAGGCSY